MPSKKSLYFDERQVEIRNKVGHQCFFILYFLLMIDLLLADYGVKWAASPTSIVIVMLSCFGYYLIRIVWAGAYARERENQKHVYLMLGLLAAITTFIAITKKTNLFKESLNISDGGFLRLLLFFFVFFTIVVVSNNISRRKNNGGNE